LRAAILTISDAVARRRAGDDAGPALASLVEDAGAEVMAMEVVPDDFALVEDRLHHYAEQDLELVFTLGGIGPQPGHVTPEATRAVLEVETPGLAEALRAEGRAHDPLAVLERGVAGFRAGTLIVNLPAAEAAVRARFSAIAPLIEHVTRAHGRP
jgi:molybdopterin adenylyltransferase